MSDKVYLGQNVSDLDYDEKVSRISRVNLSVDSDHIYTSGDDTGRTLEASCPWGSQAMADSILAKVSGIDYQPYEASDALLDQAAEIGDGITLGGVYSVLAQSSISLDKQCAANISAPYNDEIDDEYPYKTPEQRKSERQLAYARSLITKTSEEIRLEVSNELNDLSSSIDVKLGSITATVKGIDGRVTTVEQTASGLTSTVQGLNGQISTLKQTDSSLQSQIKGINGNISTLQQTDSSLQSQITSAKGSISTLDQKIDSISLSVTNGESSSTIALTVDGVQVASKKIQFTGDIVFSSDLTDGQTTISGDNILTGEISAEYLKLGGTMSVYSDLTDTYASGSLGYVTGSINGNRFTGIGMIASDDTAVLGSAQDDVLILSVNDTGIFAGNNIELHADNYVRIFGDYLIPRYDESTYCGSYSYWWLDGYFKSLHVDGSTITSSDRRLKENIDYDISKWMTMFDALKPCSYKLVKGKRTHVGMIAQEVIEAGEAAGLDMEHLTAVCLDKEGQTYGLRYEEFVPILIAKVQQLEKRLEALIA